jgi:hypothetical protein
MNPENENARRQPGAGTATVDASILQPEAFLCNDCAPSVVFGYHDTEGNPVGAVARFERGTLDAKKQFRQHRWEAGRYLSGLDKGTLPLFGLHLLGGDGPVLFCEGEKCALALRELGYTATTTPGGTGNLDAWLKARPDDLRDFAGRDCFVLPDNDQPGAKHARTLADALNAAGADARIVDVSGWAHLGNAADVADLIDNGAGRADVDALLESAPTYSPDPEAPDVAHAAVPVLDDIALHGLAGEFVQTCRRYTEAHDAGLLCGFLVYAASCCGADPEAPVHFVGPKKHHARLYVNLVGPTGRGRKGSAWDPVEVLIEAMNDLDDADQDSARAEFDALGVQPDTASVIARPGSPNIHEGGLSSGEGLGFRIRDEREIGRKKPKKGESEGEPIIDPGEQDKRLLIVQPEFGGVLRMNAREGNTLSDTLRNGWDGKDLGHLTKRDTYKATRPHPNIIGNITVEELNALMDACSHFNGFSNRFLWVYVERARFMPSPPVLRPDDLRDFAHRLRKALKRARKRAYRLTSDAKHLWDSALYRMLEERDLDPRVLRATERASPYVLRLALLFAILDMADAIDTPHLEAAAAVWAYAEQSAVFIFGPKGGAAVSPAARKVADYIRREGSRVLWSRLLQYGPPCARTTDKAQALIAELVDAGMAAWVNGPPAEVELL